MKLGEILVTAGEYTLLGMGTVFVVLIIIALVISCFGILKKTVKAKAPEEEKAPAAAAAAPAASAQSSDDQLIAVITAAVAAYMASEASAVPKDGEYVVRSIRRATWKHTLSE